MKYFITGSIILFIIVFSLNQIESKDFFETYYFNGVYQSIRWFYNLSFNFLPFAFIYIVFPIAILSLLFVIYKSILQFRNKNYIKPFLLPVAFFLLFYSMFYILWGFNYKVKNLKQRLELPTVELDTNMIISEVKNIMPLLEKYRNEITKDTSALDIKYRPKDIESIIRRSQKQLFASWNISSEYDVRVRKLNPKGILLVFSTAGIYIPFSFEGHYDGGLSHIQSGYVIAHEMAHGYGITSEADCNFVALLTCIHSENEYLKYTGLLTYWRYLMSELRDKAPYSFYYLAYDRPIGLRKDIKEIYRCLDLYPDVLPDLRDIFYDSYLKANGVEEGLRSYNQVIDLYIAWKEKKEKFINQ